MQLPLVISSVLLWALVVINLFLTLALVRRVNIPSGPQPVVTLPVGQAAPEFDTETLKGERATLADYKGHALALVFISPTCGHCRKAIPEVESLGATARKSGSEMIFVVDAEKMQAEAFVQEQNITLPVLCAPSTTNPFLKDYKIEMVPMYVALDSRGKVLGAGGLTDPQLKRILEQPEKEGA